MKCLRCGGLMACEEYLDMTEMSAFEFCDGWRCLNCGELVDAVIVGHRTGGPEALPRGSKRTPASVH